MPDDLPIIYWDACVPLSYINEYQDRVPDIEALMQLSGRDFRIVTSVLSITEVAFAEIEQGNEKLDDVIEARIQKLWNPGSPIELVEFFQSIADRAKTLMRKGVEKGWRLNPADAIHLATADSLKTVKAFHTYDQKLEKFSQLTETKFPIVPPLADQKVIPLSPPPAPSQPGQASQEQPSLAPKAEPSEPAQVQPAIQEQTKAIPQSSTPEVAVSKLEEVKPENVKPTPQSGPTQEQPSKSTGTGDGI